MAIPKSLLYLFQSLNNQNNFYRAKENGEEYIETEETEENNEEENKENSESLDGFIMIGDSWIFKV